MKLGAVDWLKKYVKLAVAYPAYRSAFVPAAGGGRAVFIGSPVHSNLGDHLLAVQCLGYIRTLGYREVVEIPEFTLELFARRIAIAPEDTIFIAAGGWMGNLYEDELVIEDILTRWKDNRIIVLPQTVFFSGDSARDVARLRRALEGVEDLTLCVREPKSYRFCREELGLSEDRCLLLPDMALLAMRGIRPKEHGATNRILFAMRQDAERARDGSFAELRDELTHRGYTIGDSSSVVPEKIVPIARREAFIRRKIREFARADLVVTDRLHAMIFALLAGTKCIAMDNATHKVLGVASRWLRDYPGLRAIHAGGHLAPSDVLDMLASDRYPQAVDFTEQFAPLTRKARCRQNGKPGA